MSERLKVFTVPKFEVPAPLHGLRGNEEEIGERTGTVICRFVFVKSHVIGPDEFVLMGKECIAFCVRAAYGMIFDREFVKPADKVSVRLDRAAVIDGGCLRFAGRPGCKDRLELIREGRGIRFTDESGDLSYPYVIVFGRADNVKKTCIGARNRLYIKISGRPFLFDGFCLGDRGDGALGLSFFIITAGCKRERS